MFKSAVSTVPDEAVLIRPGRLHLVSYYTQGARLALRVYVIVHNIGITEASECQTISSETQRKTVSFCIIQATARIHPPHTKDMDADCGKRLRKALYASVNNLQKGREKTLWESVSLEDISLCPLMWNALQILCSA